MAALKKLSLACALVFASSVSYADDHIEPVDAPDPGDHTKVSTVMSATYGKQSLGENDNDFIQFLGQASGSKVNGNLFLGQLTLEAQENKGTANPFASEDLKMSKLRARYFEVSHTNWENAPMMGISLDYIETSFAEDPISDRLFAVGGLVRMTTPFKNWLSFPILAVAVGQNNGDYADVGVVDDYAYGFQFNFLNSIYLSENGTHIQFNPQFSSIEMGGMLGTVNTLQLDTAFQMPLSKNRKHWGKLTYTEYFDNTGDSGFGHNKNNTELKFTYSYYL
jgi:hypothetical protein